MVLIPPQAKTIFGVFAAVSSPHLSTVVLQDNRIIMTSLLTIAILGIAASLATEIITWINAKLSGTVLQGKGAFILSIVVALIGATASVYVKGDFSWSELSATGAQIWAVSQLYFVLIAQWLGLEVKAPQA